jgi:hypothetical protein
MMLRNSFTTKRSTLCCHMVHSFRGEADDAHRGLDA